MENHFADRGLRLKQKVYEQPVNNIETLKLRIMQACNEIIDVQCQSTTSVIDRCNAYLQADVINTTIFFNNIRNKPELFRCHTLPSSTTLVFEIDFSRDISQRMQSIPIPIDARKS
ncbi:hypothetical protein WN51_09288 [Melipona quadrifasciata]|uniref:Uncharacterized protein n=1 Tax=Melipona quadrifasciata TaxID=166423 RepID=A0A0M9A7Q2_9HYME|nr:hypothetical protein WN51_09288 [Melipona quadrifasciata]